MKPSKRIISLLLVLALLFTMLPVPTQAAGSKPQTSVDTGDLTIEGTNGFGNLLSQEIQESQDDSATAEEGYEAGYSIIDLTFDGSTATVEYSSLEEARLVVAVYSEDGLQMLASGETTINPEEDVATVTIEGDMPEYFLASAYLMDTHDLSPLCAAYDTPMYTQEMQELLESTVDDYDPDRVLNLDEDKTTNFAVYAEDTILVEPVDGFNIVTTVDDENGIYVIENADEQITSLQVGDVFSYAYGENEILIVKVAAITVDGTTVTITGSDELEMDEVFSYVKIENTGDTDDLVIDESTVDEGLVYEGVETENGSIQPQAYDGSISHKTSLKYKIAYKEKESGVEVSGTANFSVTLNIELYISWSYSRVEVTLNPVMKLGAQIKCEVESDGVSLKMGEISLPFMYGAAMVKFTPQFVAELSGSVSVEAKVSAKFGFYFESGKNGLEFQLIRTSSCDLFKLDAEVGVFVGLQLTPKVEVLGGSIVDAKITGKIGVEATSTPTIRELDDNADIRHACDNCFDGDLSAVLNVNASLKVLGKNALKKLPSTSISFVDWKAKFADFYFCYEHLDFGWGGCPNNEYRTTVYVTDTEGSPLVNAEVYIGDQEKQTNKNGIAVFYLKYGTHDISADYEELYAQKTVGINKAQKVSLIARPDDYPSGYSENIFGSIIPDDIVDDTVVYISGQCGDDLFWNLLSDGRLFIGGTGPMWNYDYGEAPWYSERSSITEVWLGRGFVDEVTSIGDYAFADCTNLSWVVNADFVTYIGDFAFYGCKSLTNEGMSDCVTTIGSNAFAYCTSLTSVELPDSLTTIGNRAFEHCRKLISVNIPDSVITIGDSAFYYCDNLTSVTIGKSVTTIGNGAFAYCRKLKSVEIPDSMITIGDSSFTHCGNLTSVIIPDSVTGIGNRAFAYCEKLQSMEISDGVTALGDSVFLDCNSLSSVKIPDSVITIGDSAFRGCDNLASVVIPDNVTTIGNFAFNGCTNLINVEIGDSVTTIGDTAFGACHHLSSVNIPDSVITIGDSAFASCTDLRSVTIGNSVTRIGDFAFSSCYYLTSVSIPDSVITIGDHAFDGCDFRSVKIGNNVTSIGYASFAHSSLASVEIPDNVNIIGDYAFWDCNNLKSVTIGNGVTTIGNNAFDNCDNMVSVTIGYSVTTVGDYAFGDCLRLKEIKFRGNAPMIGSDAFDGVGATAYGVGATAYYPAKNTTWTSDVLKDYGGTITWVPYTLDGNGNMITNADAAFTVDAKVAEIGLPDVSVEAAMIQNNLQISEPDFGNREEPLNPNAVYDGEYSTIVTETYTLKTASFSGLVPGEQYVLLAMVSIDVENPLAADNLLYIDQAAALEDGTLVFQYVQRTPTETSYVVACGASNKDLNDAEISFPEMIADGETLIVNPTVVYDGKTLTEGQDYTIQGTVSVTEPGTYTCYIRGIRNYSGLVECTYAVITPYNEVAYGFCGDNMTWTFYDNGRLTISGMGEMTEFDSNSSVPWNDRRSSILAVIVEDGVTTISDFAFAECANLTSVKIGNSVTTIGDLAFSECPSLTSVKIPDSVSTIGSYVFQDCSSLTKVTIGNSLTNISAGAFQYCSSLASVTIGESVTTIGYGAFQSCTSLSNITLPNSVINIGNAAFKSCTGLTSVTIGEAVTDIGSSAFSGCTSLISVEIPQSVTTIGDSAFGFCSNLIGIYVDEGNQDYSSDECGVLFDKKKNELIHAPGAISGSYKIPDGVSTISNDAFNFCTRLSSVEIPSSVATIEYSAFESCTGMTSVVIPYGVIRIGDEAFKSCTGLTSVSIPDSVTHIGNEAFSSCTNLTSVLIGESVGAIGNYAFRACTSLIEIDVDERNPNYSSDDWGVLYDKEKVELIQAPAALSGSYEIPDSVTTIESYAFRSCASLTSLTIPQSVDTIGNYAFSSCIGLSQITFMGDAPTINAGAFSSVTATAYYPATNPTWSEDIFQSYGGTITWTTGTPGCVDHRYNMVVKEPTCTEQGYTTYTCPTCGDFYTTDETQPLGHNYESIANGSGKLTYTCSICGYSYTNDIQDDIVYGFYDDGVWINGYTGSARRLLLPGAIDARVVTRIGDKAFFECSTLVSVTIQGMVTHIGNSAFEGCTSLSGITIPYYTSSIGDYAFRDCSSLSTIYFEGNAPAFGEDVFNGVIATAFYPAGNDTWTDEVMQDFGGVITWLPDTERLDYSVFENYVEIYGYEGKATELIIPAEIEGLPVTTIGWSAFANCDNLASVTIPASVTAIGNSAFAWCDSLATIYFEGDAPTFGEDVFSNVYATAYFPDTTTWTDEVLRDYGGGIEWKTLDDLYLDPGLEYEVYGDHVEIIEYYNRVTTEFVIPAKINRLPVTVIRTEAFKYCDSLISISIPEGVTYIGDKAFYNLDTLNSVSIHGNISYIGDSAFERCSNLTTINIPDSVTHIGKYAFMYCENLTGNINITEKITYIGDYAFYCCYNLTGSVTIPAGSIFIGRGIFSECDSLTSVTFQDGVTSIVDELFCGCNSMTNITIPDTVTIIGDSAFEDCDGLTSIDIPASITHVGAEAFEFCSRLKTIRFLGDAPEFGENVFLSVYGKAYYPGSNPTWTTEVMENCEDYSISWVAEGEVFGMEIVSTPKSGFVGQEPDLSDLCVELIYGNNIRRRTDNWYLTISEIDTTVAGKKNVTISYGDFSEEFTFFVHETEPGIVLDPSLYPESEHNYGNNLVENRSLTWPGTIGLVLLFSEKTYVEDGCDWITVLDGKGNRLAIYSGSEAAGVTLVVPGDTVQILLNSDYSSSGYGYSFDSITTLNTHHTGSTIAPVVEPTCTEPGHTEGFICEVCDQPQYTAIPALGHDFGEWETVTEASCTEKGVEQQQCSRCDHAEIRFYKALGHVWDAGIVTIEPTEDTAGERLYTCTVCGATKTEPIPVSEHEHSYELVVTAPTCTEQGYTTYTCRCGDSYTSDYVNALNHDMGEWRIDTEATCTEDGVKQRKCFRCDYNESRVIEATGHSWDKGVVTREPTEEIEGERLYTCTACGATMTESIPVIGHEHSYMAVVTAPTCTARGYTTYTCRCGESYTSDYVDALDHAWGDWIVIQEPTSTEDGMEEHICSRCGHTEQRSITKLENPFVDVAPGSFFYEPVMWAIENGITNGTSATTFGPNDQCMRAHVVTFLWRAMGSPEPKLTDNPFVDVKPTDFYYKPVLWALENGVTSGMDSTHFGPTLYCNRAQVVTFLYRTMGSPEVESTKNPFTDVASGSFYEKPVLWAVTNGVTSGMSATSFGPNSICNRAQIVTFLYRAFAND